MVPHEKQLPRRWAWDGEFGTVGPKEVMAKPQVDNNISFPNAQPKNVHMTPPARPGLRTEMHMVGLKRREFRRM
jgi:hypothetical protein